MDVNAVLNLAANVRSECTPVCEFDKTNVAVVRWNTVLHIVLKGNKQHVVKTLSRTYTPRAHSIPLKIFVLFLKLFHYTFYLRCSRTRGGFNPIVLFVFFISQLS